MRLSTALTPRVIACAEESPQFVALPRGCQVSSTRSCTSMGFRSRSKTSAPAGARAISVPRTADERATGGRRRVVADDIGVFVAPPGVGKTVVGTYLVAARACSTLVLVHRQPLLDQWVAQLSLFLGIEPKEIGQIGGGKKTGKGHLDVAMVQSLVRKDSVSDIVAGYGHVIVDECHHLPAVSFERVLSEVKARYVVGLTATPQRRDGHHPIAAMQLGPVRFAVESEKPGGATSVRAHALRARDRLSDIGHGRRASRTVSERCGRRATKPVDSRRCNRRT